MHTLKDVAAHNSRASCWVVIRGQVYDLTNFLDEHPGGAAVVLEYGGKDATGVFEAIHPRGTIDQLPRKRHLCAIEVPSDKNASDSITAITQTNTLTRIIPPLSSIQNLEEFESIAKTALSERAWTYYSSAADGLHSHHSNLTDWAKISFRPRVLRNVSRVSLRRSVMGHESSLPVFIAPTAHAKLGHDDGESGLARAASRHNIVYTVSSASSTPHDQVARAFRFEEETTSGPGLRFGKGMLAFQLYLPPVNTENVGRERINRAKKLGYGALVVTVDTPVLGKREEDERFRASLDDRTIQRQGIVAVQRATEPGDDKDVLRGYHASSLTWDDLVWIRDAWGSGPIIVKGIQSAEDALRATQAGAQGIYLSNHGGRQLDHAPSSIATLFDINIFCPEMLGKVDIYLDGGVRRGTDVVKALCLGATGVGLGRPFLYALGGYGTDGVVRAIQLLSDEIETTMRLLGASGISDLSPAFLNTAALERDSVLTSSLGTRLNVRGKL
ncbi:FMN-dependent alpha-hydroxy acid dehydrogenase [Aspergillus stella-maris]|uniref:FMN-dependent alpha-hydroxy acid dehydrogenase n=1 Tax=Aspergillus stella-maris TaxID=1810926 RepID=UPI003CCD63C3